MSEAVYLRIEFPDGFELDLGDITDYRGLIANFVGVDVDDVKVTILDDKTATPAPPEGE